MSELDPGDSGYPLDQGRIVCLEVANFKSYRGYQKIGPFKSFTAVIGPNGSGKSNLMDAISFVLGVKTAQLRGSLKELLYSNSEGNSDDDRPRRGYVRLVYCEANGVEIHFSRVILPSGSGSEAAYQSQYKLNDKTCSWEAYNNKLCSYGILVKAKNFLVFQGDIESVAAMSAKDLTNLFEHISGSDVHRKDYEALEAERTAAEEKMRFIFSKKKNITAERKHKKDQKEEAEKHLRLQQELEELKADYYLWQIYHIDKDTAAARAQSRRLQSEMKQAALHLKGSEDRVEEQRREHAKLTKNRLLVEKNINKRKAETEKHNPEAVKVGEEISRLHKKMKSTEKALKDSSRKHKEQQTRVNKLQKDLGSISAAQESLEEDLAREAREGKISLDGELVAEYNSIKEQAGAKTCKMQQDADALRAVQQADEEALHSLEDTVKSIDTRLAQTEHEREEAQRHHDRITKEAAQAKVQLHEKKAERGILTDESRRAGAQRDYLAKKLDDAEAALKEAKADRKESERERRMAAAVADMKRLFPGVFGRVTELAKVTTRRYNLALAVVMGRDMDSMVVDTDKTARECIAHLKLQRVPPMTFFPLNTVKAKPVNERLRQLGGTAKLALDLLEYDPALERAFLAVCGNTLVCETVAEAKQLSYMGPERHKVVSADGTMINKAGLITGGRSANMEERASRWDDAMLENLKQDVAKLNTELGQLPDLRQVRQAEQRMTGDIAGLERKIQFMTTDLGVTAEKLERLAAEHTALQAEKERQAPEMEGLRKKIAVGQRKLHTIQSRIDEIKDRMFAAFSAKVGVANIRLYEEQHLKAAERAAEQRTQLSNQVSKLQNQLAYERRTDLHKPVQQLQQELEADKQLLAERQEAEARVRAKTEAAQEHIAKLQADAAGLREQCDALEADLKQRRDAAAKQQAAGHKLSRALASCQAAIEQLAARRADVLETATVEQVELPVSESTEPGREDSLHEDAMEVDDPDQAGPSNAPAQAAGAALPGRRMDFSRLKRHHMAATNPEDRAKLDADFKASMEEMTATLARLAPNLKALEQYEAIKEKEREQSEELEEARKHARTKSEAFNAVRQARHDAFMTAFDHVSGAIDRIFKDLTKSAVHPIGGQAYLSLESSEEPYLGGIKYTAMPPTKRFRDMELLSGGEKTLAALALLFAIHSYQSSPFFVLDEIDAALDATNVARVAKYIHKKTRAGAEGAFQSIVISLKDNFYHNADALIGVCRDPQSGCSQTLTFDLTRFEEEA